jgi:formate dehydrogenase subunit gamma
MNKAIGALALGLGLLAATASAQQQPATGAGAPGPQSANIFEVTRDDQAARQQVQPLNNAPVWRAVNSGQAHYTTLPANEGGVLIDQGGEPWRELRNGPMTQGGGWGLVGVLVLIAAFYLIRGEIKLSAPRTGRLIERFTILERIVHWTNAASFITLAITGVVMLFGKHLLLPLFGPVPFSWLALLSKTTHNFVGPLFAATTIAIFLTFVKDNIPRAYDIQWFMKGGGLIGKNAHVPSHRFNGGEKALFWGGVVLLGIISAVTGFILDFPNFGQGRWLMQEAWWIHVSSALLFMAIIAGHIYIGTIGTEGALEAMTTGYVDETWAKDHHDYWYDDVKAGKIPAVRTQAPVAGGAAATAESSAG